MVNALTLIRLLILVCTALMPSYALAMTAPQAELSEFNKTGEFDRVRTLVQESRPFYGMASYCLLYTSPSPRDQRGSRMPSSA